MGAQLNCFLKSGFRLALINRALGPYPSQPMYRALASLIAGTIVLFLMAWHFTGGPVPEVGPYLAAAQEQVKGWWKSATAARAEGSWPQLNGGTKSGEAPRKCVGQGKVLYTTAPCPASMTEEPMQSGPVTVIPMPKPAPEPPAASPTSPTKLPRFIAPPSPAQTQAERDKAVEDAIR